ncbi:MAG TPA: TetR/AcrR family transcriptional regulator [Solirubrobacterales bacterium]|nr:TetR/AcrR family transcriptional regulator [Solirubrobacterales bacterium]
MAVDPGIPKGDRGLIGWGSGGQGPKLPEPPKQARGAEKRDRIYAAAIARFQRAGVAGTTVEEVIADAGVSWATFFRYFPRKEDVLLEGIARHFRDHVVPLAEREISDERTPVRDAIERIFKAVLEASELSQALHNQAFVEVFSNPPRFAALVDNGHPAPVIGLITEVLAQGQSRGELDPNLNTGFAALTVAAGATFPAAQAAAAGADPGQSIGPALDLLWSGVAADGD